MKSGAFNQKVYCRIRPTAASIPTFYGLPKIHVNDTPLRPILSSTGKYNHDSATWLSEIRTPLRHHPCSAHKNSCFCNKCLGKFENDTKPDSQDKEVDDYACILGLPYFEKPSGKFASQLFTLLKQKFGLQIFTYYTLLNTGSYFDLTFITLAALKSNVVYKFTCSRDVNTYNGMPTRQSVTRAKEHLQLNSNSAKTAMSQHLFLPKLSKF